MDRSTAKLVNRLTAMLVNCLTATLVNRLTAKLVVVNLVKLHLTKFNKIQDSGDKIIIINELHQNISLLPFFSL